MSNPNVHFAVGGCFYCISRYARLAFGSARKAI
jgi:hypothetical protein